MITDRCSNIGHRKIYSKLKASKMGGSPGLMVIGGDSCYVGCGFESQYQMLDGPFSPFSGEVSDFVQYKVNA